MEGHLEITKAISTQDKDAVQAVCDKVCAFSLMSEFLMSISKASMEFPVLDEYQDQWATKDIIRGVLKYTTVRERNLKHRRVSKIIQARVSLPLHQ